jgi:hypothetical protein
MSRQKKTRTQRARGASAVHHPQGQRHQQQRTPGTTHLIHMLPSMDSLAEQSLSACYRVTVLLKGSWSSLDAMIRRQAGSASESDEMRALDTLVEVAAPALAQQALHHHVLEHAQIYQQHGLRALWFQRLPVTEPQDATIWGELSPKDILAELGVALTVAIQARATVPQVPPSVFWPLVGAFFSTVDNSPHISTQTWESIVAHPEQYTLLQLRAPASYGTVAEGEPQHNQVFVTEHDSAWRYCQQCGRAAQNDEYILWENRRLCPYWCNGEIGWHTMNWEVVRGINPHYPAIPRTWTFYPFDEMEPNAAWDGVES